MWSCTETPNGRRWWVEGIWGGGGGGGGMVVARGVFSTSEARRLTGLEYWGKAVGEPRPQMVFHLLQLHTELPSSQRWESALRSASDPTGSAVVTAHPSPNPSSDSRRLYFSPVLLCGFFSRSRFFAFSSRRRKQWELMTVFLENESKTVLSATK